MPLRSAAAIAIQVFGRVDKVLTGKGKEGGVYTGIQDSYRDVWMAIGTCPGLGRLNSEVVPAIEASTNPTSTKRLHNLKKTTSP
jgi:hypothetical protein